MQILRCFTELKLAKGESILNDFMHSSTQLGMNVPN